MTEYSQITIQHKYISYKNLYSNYSVYLNIQSTYNTIYVTFKKYFFNLFKKNVQRYSMRYKIGPLRNCYTSLNENLALIFKHATAINLNTKYWISITVTDSNSTQNKTSKRNHFVPPIFRQPFIIHKPINASKRNQ